MKTDIQIAQETMMLPITQVAADYGIGEDDLELYGKYKAKLTNEFRKSIEDRPDGKLVLVTAINPTPAGEGKTTTTHWPGPGSFQSRKEDSGGFERTVPGSVLWNQGRSSRRRLFPGGSHGGFKPSFHRRFPCNYHGEQSAGSPFG